MAVTRATPTASQPLVLIGFAEALAAIESAWMLLDAGFRVAAFGRSSGRPALAYDKRVAVHRITSPGQDTDTASADLLRLVERLRPDVVLPLDDSAVWLCDHAWRCASLPPLAGARGAQASLALDKVQQLALASRAGFAVPPTVVCSPGSHPTLLDAPGPWIVKPALAAREANGQLVRGTPTRVGDPSHARAVLQPIAETMLVQPVLQGVGEGVFGHAGSHRVTGWSAHRRIRMMDPSGSGSSACRSVDVGADVRDPAAAFVAEAGWQGMFMLELLRDAAGTPWWMELNGRPWGSMALARYRGLPYPVWAVRAALEPGFVPAEPLPTPHVTARHLGREILHVAMVARGPAAGSPQSEWPRMLPTLRAVLTWRRGDRLYHYRRGLARVLAADTWQTGRDKFARRQSRRRP